jgi:Ecdysteroid kinase-like family
MSIPTPPLPMSIQDITAEWLTSALREGGRDVKVNSTRHLATIAGAATKIRFQLEYDASTAGSTLPQTVIVKMATSEGPMDLMSAGFYHREAFFYGHVSGRYDIRLPKFYFARGQYDPDQAVILIEDLAQPGTRFGSALRPYSPDEVASGLEALAQLHSRSMTDRQVAAIGLPTAMKDSTVIFNNMIRDADALFGAARAFAVPIVLHDRKRLATGLEKYRALVRSIPNCIVHGDAHVGNTYCDRNGVVSWLDWQLAGMGHWIHDVQYFMGTALDAPDRRKHERDLLKHYREVAVGNGADMPDSDEVWRLYRAGIFYGFITWLGTAAAYQPENICTACLGRFGAAMTDLDTYSALGVG